MKMRIFFQERRFLFFVLCLLIFFSPMALPSRPVYALDQDTISQLQEVRQQLAELLTLYQSMDANERAAIDAAIASEMRQALQQIYGSLSLSDQNLLDEQTRQATGYSFSQLFSSMSTVPGFAEGLDILISGLMNSSNGTNASTPIKPTTTKPPATKPTTAESSASPGTIGFEPPEQGGVVDFNSDSLNLKVNLGLQLFGDPNMSKETAVTEYKQNIEARRFKLNAEKATAEKRIAKLEKARDAKNLNAYIDNVQINLAAAKSDRVEALDQFVQSLGTAARDELRSLLIDSLPGALADESSNRFAVLTKLAAGTNTMLDAYPALKTIQEKINKNEELTSAEWTEVGEASVDLIGILNDKTIKSKWVSRACTGAKLTGQLLDISVTQVEVNSYESSLAQLSVTQKNVDILFQHKIDVETMKIREYDRQIERLKQGGYIDPKYLKPS